MENKDKAQKIKLFGTVQGVGFRPYVYLLAEKFGLKGWVQNDSQGMALHWEGTASKIDRAFHELLASPPPLAEITGFEMRELPPAGYSHFVIQRSSVLEDKRAFIPPDVGICPQCLAEFEDPADRRFHYPFINCVNCGPRFTIVRDLPYDRRFTVMDEFTMCPECRQEYEHPGSRRFHAQPNACPACGPRLLAINRRGEVYTQSLPVLFREGSVVAVKSLGGFHLACSALDSRAVSRLRNGKFREDKPFAVMAFNLETVRRYCLLSSQEERYLTSPARPIVILRQIRETAGELAPEINPNLDTLGMMLPYTPLHLLLFSPEVPLLVMTSANLSGNPLITTNEEAKAELKDAADYLLIHNRKIENFCDDSVGMVVGDTWQLVRRARGFVPSPVRLQTGSLIPLLACGADLKNTFALSREEKVFLSPHLGDLQNALNFKIYRQSIEQMIALLGIQPRLIVHDLHPGYRSAIYAGELAARWDLPALGVQHHHAHLASCMAENGLRGRTMGVICDGTGYGTDGGVWGFEFLLGDYGSFERMGSLAAVPLPGGEVSIKRPSRMAYSFLVSTLGESGKKNATRWLRDLSLKELEVLEVQLAKGLNSVIASSCGRLFDAAAALMGICREAKYEGQGPMEMEAGARRAVRNLGSYSIALELKEGSGFELDTVPLWEELIRDLELGRELPEMAFKFHLGVARAIRDGVLQMSRLSGLTEAVISGGVFQNRLLTELVLDLLKSAGIKVYRHREVPPNDGGISLGQAVIGNEVIKNVPGCAF